MHFDFDPCRPGSMELKNELIDKGVDQKFNRKGLDVF